MRLFILISIFVAAKSSRKSCTTTTTATETMTATETVITATKTATTATETTPITTKTETTATEEVATATTTTMTMVTVTVTAATQTSPLKANGIPRNKIHTAGMSYDTEKKIRLDDGRIWTRHVNQMRSIGQKTPNVEERDNNTHYWESENTEEVAEDVNIQDPQLRVVPRPEPDEQAQVQENVPDPPQIRDKNARQPILQTPRRSTRVKKRPDYLAEYTVR
ncbi:hypothetical protein DMN91_012110 [Ooceraea biroi]|uniref:Uncharacterized protein n=1 Tax=Ooceraea biroi TaxID=2015173 RepID=A0A3L8D7B6_OOCBI|nr:hypothetical protein DMN91_012110 [Ooceraea biroi]